MSSAAAFGLISIAAIQAAVSLIALSSSPKAAAAAAAIGVLALGRYAALSLFASSVCDRRGRLGRLPAASAWILSLAAMGAAIAAIGVKAAFLLPWAVAAAIAGPACMFLIALARGVAVLAAGGKA